MQAAVQLQTASQLCFTVTGFADHGILLAALLQQSRKISHFSVVQLFTQGFGASRGGLLPLFGSIHAALIGFRLLLQLLGNGSGFGFRILGGGTTGIRQSSLQGLCAGGSGSTFTLRLPVCGV